MGLEKTFDGLIIFLSLPLLSAAIDLSDGFENLYSKHILRRSFYDIRCLNILNRLDLGRPPLS